MSKPRGVFRVIRDGQVRIFGRTYVPTERTHPTSIPYAGQLDGQCWYFGLYWGPPNYDRYDERGLASFVSLWGTEAAAKSKDALKDWPGPNCINGYFQWEWWECQ